MLYLCENVKLRHSSTQTLGVNDWRSPNILLCSGSYICVVPPQMYSHGTKINQLIQCLKSNFSKFHQLICGEEIFCHQRIESGAMGVMVLTWHVLRFQSNWFLSMFEVDAYTYQLISLLFSVIVIVQDPLMFCCSIVLPSPACFSSFNIVGNFSV